MPTPREPIVEGDARRDAERYDRLLLALEHARHAVQTFDGPQRYDLDAVLGWLLQDFSSALDAEVAFTGQIVEPVPDGPGALLLTGVHPFADLAGGVLPLQGLLAEVASDHRTRVVDPLGAATPQLIAGLESLRATSAVVACTRGFTPARMVGVCNRKHAAQAPFLGKDGRNLDNLLELLTLGARIGDRHARHLKAIQEGSAAALRLTNQDELLAFITRHAAGLFEAPATSVMLWDARGQALVTNGGHGLSEAYIRSLSIPRSRVEAALAISGPQPMITADLRETPFADAALAAEEGLRSALSAPLMTADGDLMGVLNIFSKGEPRAFGEDERELAMIYANQIAAALENARLFGQVRQRSRHWEALHTSAKAITAGISAERRSVLDRIVEEAVERIGTLTGSRPISGILQLYTPETSLLAFESLYPPELWPTVRAQVGDSRLLDRATAPGGRIGITGRAALEGRAQRVDDVHVDPDYLEINPATVSELAAPLLDGRDVLGVLSLESETPDAFDENDEMALRALAELAVIAVKNSAAADALSRANAVAMLGAWAADVLHDLNREVGAIRRSVYILKQQPRLKAAFRERLEEIDRGVERLAFYALPEEPARSGGYTDPRLSAPVDEVIMAELADFRVRYPSVTWKDELNCLGIWVTMHPQWLSRVLRHLVRNALEALEGQPNPTVWMHTTHEADIVFVKVKDNGPGVQAEIENQLFRQPITHQDSTRVRGRGLLLVHFLVERHGGTISLLRNKPGEGACFQISLPIAMPKIGA